MYVREDFLEPVVLDRAPAPPTSGQLMTIVAAIAASDKSMRAQQISDRLEQMRERTPRGQEKWSSPSVKMQLDRAQSNGPMIDTQWGMRRFDSMTACMGA